MDLIYWGLDDVVVVLIIAFSVLSVYFAFDITRITRGAPRAWYIVISGFLVLLVYRVVQLYFDLQAPQDFIRIEEATMSLLAGALLAVGLFMLDQRFKAQQKAAAGS